MHPVLVGRPVGRLLLALLGVTLAFAIPLSQAARAGTLEYNKDCGDVSPFGYCGQDYFVSGHTQWYGRFSLVNGSGVDHWVRLEVYPYYSNWYGGTAQYIRTPCFSTGYSDLVASQGFNNSGSPHHYTLQTYSGCY